MNIFRFNEFINENKNELSTIINSLEFKKWFKNSEMVDSNDQPMIFYHGSKNKFDNFDKNKIGNTDAGWLGYGFYFYTDPHEAMQYGEISAYFLNIENPYFATDDDNLRLSELNDIEVSKEFTESLIDDGYDGVYYNGNLRGETVVFELNQIWKINIEAHKLFS